MEMTISVSDVVASKLEVRAASRGQTAPAYAAQLVAETLSKPTLDELLTPVRADFAKTGLGENELLDLGREAVTRVRKEKKANPSE